MHRVSTAVCAVLISALSAASSASAKAYDELVVFGDSLSDNGNVYNAFFQLIPKPPYFQGRFSNGPVAVEVMADKLGIPLKDYAFGGASTGLSNVYVPGSTSGMQSQISAFAEEVASAGKAIDTDALYVVWGGGNDLLSVLTSAQPSNIDAAVVTAVTNLLGNVHALYKAGARDVLVPLLPDLASSYYGTSGAMPSSMLSGVSSSFNDALRLGLNALGSVSAGLNLQIFDSPTVLAGIRDGMAAQGGNVTDRCWTGEFSGTKGTLCADPSKYYLFDRVHPTAVVHEAFGLAMAAAVPEPGSIALVLAGVAVLVGGGAMRRRQEAALM